MTFTAAAIKSGHTPEARAKAVATMKRLGVGIFKKRGKKAKAANGKTDTIDIRSLPSRPSARRKKTKRTLRTPQDRAQLVARIDALIATGKTIKDASRELGLHDTQYRTWKKHPKRWLAGARLNGHALLNGNAGVKLVVRIAGQELPVSLQDAQSLRADLDALLGHA